MLCYISHLIYNGACNHGAVIIVGYVERTSGIDFEIGIINRVAQGALGLGPICPIHLWCTSNNFNATCIAIIF